MALFVSGQEGYHTYRIPSLLVTEKGTVLAFCEARKNGGGDAGDIDLALRRSFDHGITWEPYRIIADLGPDTVGNPCAVQDRDTGTIWSRCAGMRRTAMRRTYSPAGRHARCWS